MTSLPWTRGLSLDGEAPKDRGVVVATVMRVPCQHRSQSPEAESQGFLAIRKGGRGREPRRCGKKWPSLAVAQPVKGAESSFLPWLQSTNTKTLQKVKPLSGHILYSGTCELPTNQTQPLIAERHRAVRKSDLTPPMSSSSRPWDVVVEPLLDHEPNTILSSTGYRAVPGEQRALQAAWSFNCLGSGLWPWCLQQRQHWVSCRRQ